MTTEAARSCRVCLPRACVSASEGGSRKERGGQRPFSRAWVHQPDRSWTSVCSRAHWTFRFPSRLFTAVVCFHEVVCLTGWQEGWIHPRYQSSVGWVGLSSPPLLDVYLCFPVFHPADHLNFDVIKSITLSFVSYYLCLLTQNFPWDSELILCIFC